MNGLIVIGYDGSEEAGHAIDVATTIVGPTEAVVVNVWTPALVTTSAAPLSPVAPALPEEAEEEEACLEEAAWRIAGEGARRASDAGLPARTDTRCGATADVGRLLAALADEYDADSVVVGRRGVSRLHSTVLGSVSNDRCASRAARCSSCHARRSECAVVSSRIASARACCQDVVVSRRTMR